MSHRWVGGALVAHILGQVVDSVAQCHLEPVQVDFLCVLLMYLGVLDHFNLFVFLLVGGFSRPFLCFGSVDCEVFLGDRGPLVRRKGSFQTLMVLEANEGRRACNPGS